MMRKFLSILMAAASGPLFAADIASDIRSGSDGPDTGDGGYAEVGLALNYGEGSRRYNRHGNPTDGTDASLSLVFNGEFRYRGLFAEAARGSLDGLNLGYNLWSNDFWTVDLLASSGYGRGVDSDNADISFMSEEDRNLELKKRVYSFRGSGIRATGYFGDYIFQYRLLADHFNDTGVVSTARLGRSWQIGNWNLHGLASLRYDSAKTNQEAFGIATGEATSLFPEYRPGSSITWLGEVGATYPVSKNWVFRATARLSQQSDEAKRSPLRQERMGVFFSSSISYVFGE